MSDESDGAIGYLSGSPARVEILERLADGTARPAGLVELADVSRTTVHRTLTELVDRRWARRVDGGYAATTTGELALETYRDARTRFRTLDRIEPFLAHVDGTLADLDVAWLRTAELVTASGTNPHQPLEWYADRLAAADADRLRGVSPVISRQFIAVHAPIIAAGTPTELVVGESTFQAITDQYPAKFRESLSHEHYDLYVIDETPAMGLTLVGERAFLGAYDDGGQFVAALESTDDRLREWADARYRERRSDARRVSDEADALSQ